MSEPTKLTLEAVQAAVIKILAKFYGLESPDLATLTSAEAGMDSLDQLEFIMFLEEELNCSIPDEKLKDLTGQTTFTTLADIVLASAELDQSRWK
jgi:acyl carrier protein